MFLILNSSQREEDIHQQLFFSLEVRQKRVERHFYILAGWQTARFLQHRDAYMLDSLVQSQALGLQACAAMPGWHPVFKMLKEAGRW